VAHHVRMYLSGRPGDGTNEIEIGGMRVENLVAALTLEGSALNPSRLTLRLTPRPVHLSGDMAVTVDDETARLLVELGWRPPA
jgi:hypothetical protein